MSTFLNIYAEKWDSIWHTNTTPNHHHYSQFRPIRTLKEPAGNRPDIAESGSAAMKYIKLKESFLLRLTICPDAAEIQMNRSLDWPELLYFLNCCYIIKWSPCCQKKKKLKQAKKHSSFEELTLRKVSCDIKSMTVI